MTREEQIFSAADAAYGLSPYETEKETIAFQDGFTKGVKWCETNPFWHKYPDEKPPENGTYWVCKKHFAHIGYNYAQFVNEAINRHTGKIMPMWDMSEGTTNEVIFWMKIPTVPTHMLPDMSEYLDEEDEN